MIPEAAVEAAARVLNFHLPDSAHESGCALRCGYVGDDLAEHLAGHILEAAAPHMLADAWDAGAEAMERSTWPDGDLPDNPYR